MLKISRLISNLKYKLSTPNQIWFFLQKSSFDVLNLLAYFLQLNQTVWQKINIFRQPFIYFAAPGRGWHSRFGLLVIHIWFSFKSPIFMWWIPSLFPAVKPNSMTKINHFHILRQSLISSPGVDGTQDLVCGNQIWFFLRKSPFDVLNPLPYFLRLNKSMTKINYFHIFNQALINIFRCPSEGMAMVVKIWFAGYIISREVCLHSYQTHQERFYTSSI